MTPSILFVVNGLGLGNSTRCHALIQALAARGWRCEVATSGNGLWYFQGRPEVGGLHEIVALQYGAYAGRISIARTFLSASALLATARRNAEILKDIVAARRFDLVVTDSTYSVRPFRRLGIPIVALNNADTVVHACRRRKDLPRSVVAQLYGIELLDRLFHRVVPDLVISPMLDPAEAPRASGRVVHVMPIVRRGYAMPAGSSPPRRLAIMLSGSAFALAVRLRRGSYPFAIDVIGDTGKTPEYCAGEVLLHGRLRDTLPLLRSADFLVINGGFSAVSEAIALRKPTIVVPVPGHAEQWINSQAMVSIGLGDAATADDWEEAALRMFVDIERYRQAARGLAIEALGAEQSADAITAVAAGHLERRSFRERNRAG